MHADNGRPKDDVIGKRIFPKRGTKCRKEKMTVRRLSGRLLDTSDTPSVAAVCGYRLANRISQDSTMLHSDTFIVLNQQDRFGEICYGPHRTNHVVFVSSLVVFSSQHFGPRFGKIRFPITLALRATIVGYARCTISIII